MSQQRATTAGVATSARSRSTRQKRALAAVLDTFEGFASAQEIYALLQTSGERAGLTTVYNQLRTLAMRGELDTVLSESGESLYRRCRTTGDHYRLVCRSCGGITDVHAPELEQWAARTGASFAFTTLATYLELSALCDACIEVTELARRE